MTVDATRAALYFGSVITLLFPGQGSQKPGMGKALAEAFAIAQTTYEEADDALGTHISRLCFAGPSEELEKTENTQPAILATSIAAFRAFRSVCSDVQATYAAGHSLGEWSALVAVGALEFRDALRAVRERGRLMQRAVPEGRGAMAAILGLEPEVVRDACAKIQAEMRGEVVCAANFNSNEQTVISGTKAAVEATGRALTQAGAKKVHTLAVSAPFHSPLMQPAADGLAEVLSTMTIHPFETPVIANAIAAPYRDAERVKALLVEQVTAPVRWVETMNFLRREGALRAIEFGTGGVLAGLARRADRAFEVMRVEDDATLEKTVAALRAAPTAV